jgi:hypothetical protein
MYATQSEKKGKKTGEHFCKISEPAMCQQQELILSSQTYHGA